MNNAAAARAIVGKASTAWTSEGYKNASTIGGQKDGVGLVLELPKSSSVASSASRETAWATGERIKEEEDAWRIVCMR